MKPTTPLTTNPPTAASVVPFWQRLTLPARRGLRDGANRRHLTLLLLVLVTLLPVFYVFGRTAEARRDIIYWDEFDSGLDLALKLKARPAAGAVLHELFAISNEHRMVTSRLLFAAIYTLTGTINFATIDVIGNATIVVLCLLLIATAGSTLRRVRLGVLLAFLLFQLENYENFLWSGASIDHFQIVMLAAAAIIALARGTLAGAIVGGILATLATFTLAHGLVLWPIGALMLWFRSGRRGFATWCGFGLLAVGGFLTGFRVNQAESFATFSVEGAQKVLQYWLSILGAAPAAGSETFAPLLGGALLLLLAYVMLRGALRRERIALPLAFWAIGAAGLIALGRAEESGGLVHSRYYVLSSLAWALALFMVLQRHSHPRRPLQLLGSALPALIAFNVVANREFVDETNSWLECRDMAVVSYNQYGADGRGPFNLHPIPAHSTEMLARAEQLGVYRLGDVCLPRPFPPHAKLNNAISYYLDDLMVNASAATVRGWVGLPGRRTRRGSIHLILRSAQATLLYTAVPTTRPDVAAATKQKGWIDSGFHFARRLDRLPTGDFQIGFLLEDGPRTQYVMTAHRLILDGPRSQALLASGK